MIAYVPAKGKWISVNCAIAKIPEKVVIFGFGRLDDAVEL